MIFEANLGNYEPILRLMSRNGLQQNNFDPLLLSHGMYYALQCTEEASFSSLEEWQAAADEFPYLKPYLDENFVFGYPAMVVCDRLDLDVFNQNENDLVVSNIPTLIYSGQFDPITPPRWGKVAAQGLENSLHYTFPAMGHVVFAADVCPQFIAEQFWDDPSQSPDASCIDEMPAADFVLP
jgi:pimeloyl-ACP methyl ester carboxylesterase